MITPKTSIQFTDNTTSVTITVDGVQIAVYAKNKFSIYPNPNAGADEIDLKYVEQEMSEEIFFRFKYTQVLPLQPSKAAAVAYLAEIFFLAKTASNTGYNPTDPTNWGVIPTLIGAALDELASRENREVIGSLKYPAVWYPNEAIGVTYETASVGFNIPITTIGFYRVIRKGTFRNFGWINSFPPGSQIDAQIWFCPSGDPNTAFFTGITLSMLSGEYISTNNVDTLDVLPNDLIFLYNPSTLIGYTGGQIAITAQFIQKI